MSDAADPQPPGPMERREPENNPIARPPPAPGEEPRKGARRKAGRENHRVRRRHKDRPRRSRGGFRRWVLRPLLILIVLLVLAIVVVQILLQTAVPRSLVVSALERQLGLRVQARHLSTGWTGRTELREVALSLPLADESFLEMPSLHVRHTMPLAALLGLDFHIKSLRLERPKLTVRQDPMGRWNLEEAISLIARASGGKSNEQSQARGRPMPLPEVLLTAGTVLLIDNQGKSATLEPLELKGRPQGPLAWEVEATVAPLISLTGRMAPHQNWRHQLDFKADQIHDVLRVWFEGVPTPISIAGQWRGQVVEQTVSGRLDVHKGKIAQTPLSGTIGLAYGGGTATITPDTLVIDAGGWSPTAMRLTGGAYTIKGSQVRAEGVQLALMGGSARLDGQFDWHARRGQLSAAWTDLLAQNNVVHAGTLEASLDTPWVGRPQLRATILTKGRAPRGSWDATLHLVGAGRSWSDLDWTLNAPQIYWDDRNQDVRLKDLVLRATTSSDVLRLAELRLGQADQLGGSGEFDLRTRAWWVYLDAKALPLPRFTRPVDLGFAAAGDDDRIDIEQLEFRSGKTHASMQASYVFDLPKPLDAHVYLWRIPFAVSDRGMRSLAAGGLRAEAHANGTIQPMQIALDGTIYGNEVALGRRQVGDIAAEFDGVIDDQEASLMTHRLELLEGQWTFGARYVIPDDTFRVAVSMENLSLAHADALVSPPPNLRGMLSAVLNAELPRSDRDAWRMSGEFAVRDFAAGGYGDAGAAAESISGKLALHDDVLAIDNLLLKRGAGEGRGGLRYNLNDRSNLTLELAASDWPVKLGDGAAILRVSTDAKVDFNVRERTAAGSLPLSASIRFDDEEIGSLRASSELSGKELVVSDLTATLLGGSVKGAGSLVIDRPLHSRGDIDWTDVEASTLVRLWPALQGLRGVYGGTFRASQAIDADDPEPLRLSMRITPRDGGYNGMDLTDISASLRAGPTRIVMDQGMLRLAAGEARLWGRNTWHGSQSVLHVQSQLENLHLNQVVRAFKPDAEPMLGIINGEITAFGSPGNRKAINAEASFELRQSDLLNYDIINDLYRLMNLRFGELRPDGFGRIHARLEEQRLSIINAYYRNRGVQVFGTITAPNVYDGANARIYGYAVGNTRPLSELHLPFLREIDDIMKELQRNLTTVRIRGTVEDPDTENAALNDVGGGLLSYILGEVPRMRATATR